MTFPAGASRDGARGGLPPSWETTVLESVGRVIEFWGFKRNHGRVWALLYLGDEPLSAADLEKRLGLSKGAVSIVIRELQSWAVVRRVPVPTRSGVAYVAERDLWLMITTVLGQRELRLVAQVREDLRLAEEAASADAGLSPAQRKAVAERIRRMRLLADTAQVALDTLLTSRRLNLAPLLKILGLGGLGRLGRH